MRLHIMQLLHLRLELHLHKHLRLRLHLHLLPELHLRLRLHLHLLLGLHLRLRLLNQKTLRLSRLRSNNGAPTQHQPCHTHTYVTTAYAVGGGFFVPRTSVTVPA